MARTASVGLRFLPEVKEAAEKAAQDDRRSLASLVELVLTEWLETKGYLPQSKGGGPGVRLREPGE